MCVCVCTHTHVHVAREHKRGMSGRVCVFMYVCVCAVHERDLWNCIYNMCVCVCLRVHT
jgi:hypothetical protein